MSGAGIGVHQSKHWVWQGGIELAWLAWRNLQGAGTEPDLQIRFVPALSLDPDAIINYIKVSAGLMPGT